MIMTETCPNLDSYCRLIAGSVGLNAEQLAGLIAEVGLFPYTDDKLAEYPEALWPYCGKGLGLWQYPNQFASYLIFLSGKGIASYLEIGAAGGGTFIFTSEYLRQFIPGFASVAIDPAGPGCTMRGGKTPYSRNIAEYLGRTDRAAQFITAPSYLLYEHLPEEQEFDLVLIDGDHSYEGVMKDFRMMRQKARYLAFHDISNEKCPGVIEAWAEIKATCGDEFLFHEFTQQYDLERSFLGIGLCERR